MARIQRRFAAVVALTFLLAAGAGAQDRRDRLPEAVREAVDRAFPSAVVESFGVEAESGVRCYELNLALQGNRVEAEVDRYGGIGEIERAVSIDELPRALAEAILAEKGIEGPVRIERHERWGVAQGGRFVQLDEPQLSYEIRFSANGERRSVKWTPEPMALPEGVEKALAAAFPRAVVTEAGKEVEDGVEVFELSLVQGGRDLEVEIAADGALIEVETPMPVEDLPEAVKAAVEEAAPGARIHRVEKAEVRAEVREGQVVPLPEPKVLYEAELRKGDLAAEVEVSADGRILEVLEWREFSRHAREYEEGEDDD